MPGRNHLREVGLIGKKVGPLRGADFKDGSDTNRLNTMYLTLLIDFDSRKFDAESKS